MSENGAVAVSHHLGRPIVNVRKKPLAWAVKRQIVEYASKHPEVTQGVIASKFGCNRSTVCKILKKRDKFGGIVGQVPTNLPEKPRITQVDELTYEWIMNMRSANIPLTGTIIKETASQIADRIGQLNFQPSNDWLRQLCRRYGIPLTVNNSSIPNNNNNSPSVPNNNLTQGGSNKFRKDETKEEFEEFEEDLEDDDDFDEELDEDEENPMYIEDDNFAEHCLTDDVEEDVMTSLNNDSNNNVSVSKKMISYDQAMAAFDTIRQYFEQQGTFLGEDLEVIFELEQLCASKKKKQL